jgi:glycosyltransferase involved in cell wall biosynthesis
MSFLISICIPTYNRSSDLDILLSNIYENLVNDLPVEIVVSNNCSNDNTIDILNKWSLLIKNLKFSNNNNNEGFDYNYRKVATLATGLYVLVFGDDDVFLPGSLQYLVNIIKNNLNTTGFILNGNNCNFSKCLKRSPFINLNDNHLFTFNSFNDVLAYIDLIHNDLSFLFLFIGSFIIKRSKLLLTFPMVDFYKTGYDHISFFFLIILSNSTFLYVDKPIYNAITSKNDLTKQPGLHTYKDLESYLFLINNLPIEKNKKIPLLNNLSLLFKRKFSFKSLIFDSFNLRKINLKHNFHSNLLKIKYGKFYLLVISFFSSTYVFYVIQIVYRLIQKNLSSRL